MPTPEEVRDDEMAELIADNERLHRAEKAQMLAVLAECVASLEGYRRQLGDEQECDAEGAARHIIRMCK